jgi:(+)-pinoresinol hydroxylase
MREMSVRDRTLAGPRAALLGGLASLGLLAAAVSAQEAPDLERGQAVYEYWCAPCHAPGPGHPGTQSLQIKYDGNLPAVLEERTDLPAEAIKVFVRQGVLSMAPFRKTEISDAELDDLAAYLSASN